MKRLEEYETNADQLTNLGVGGMSSTCPTTKVILPHTWDKMTNTGCLIVKKKISCRHPFVCRLIIITFNDSAYACLSYTGFKVCEIITNFTILETSINSVINA